jgi:N-methylhydantoinase B/oxoprolinase/acetone carboxylase alpha subunit
MGGTTAKAALVEGGQVRETGEYEVGGGVNFNGRTAGSGYAVRVPVLDIAEVGAGGGSIAWVDPGGALQVGPRSAGARPGPACYNLGGSQPTVTDANVALGYINPHAIAGGGLTLAPELAHTALAQVAEPLQLSIQDAAWAVHRVANATMMRALRAVSTERGRDPRDFTLVAFGGSGPLHAAAAARELGIRRVLVPPAPGLFSALGLLLADAQLDLVRTAFVSAVDADPETMEAAFADMERQAREQLSRQGFGEDAIRLERSAEMHYRGQSTELGIGLGAGPLTRSAVEDVVERFEQEHERSYGYRTRNEPVEIVNLRLRVSGVRPSLSFQDVGLALLSRARDHAPASSRPAYFGPELGVVETAVLRRADLNSQPRRGPFIVEEFDTTIVVPPDCLASLDQAGNIVLLLDEVAAESEAAAGDPITFAVIKNALHAIADEMALTIWRTGRSIGAKDILDYSTALFDAQGRLVAQGVTSPVQLGGISGGMQSVLERFGDSLKPGDVILFNDPYAGGMHLPDILVYRPIFLEGERIGFAGVLLHHADMGGRVPGGNAADSTEIFQEGLRLPPLKLYSEGVLNETLWDLIATNVRVPDLVLGDIQAQWAACYKAEQDLLDLVRRYGLATLRREMQALLDYSARMTRAEIAKLPDGEYSFEDWLDDDGVTDDPVRLFVTARVSGDRLQISFDGSSPQTRGAMNMTMAATRSTVYFCVRSIMGMDIPVNAGFCDAVEVSAPLGSVANLAFPASCGARGATLFRTIDCLFGMLGKLVPERVWAASDGGCSIVVFAGRHDDNRPFISFETVSGCWGGRPDRDGVEGITTPGINMRNTPIEVIEAQFPLIMQRYGYMADTGGPGLFRGGLSVEREYRFVGREAVLQIRSDRRRFRPFGVAGGGEGSPSLNLLNPGPAEQVLRSKITTTIGQGEVYRHLLPGAGGWGPPLRRDPLRVLDDLRNEKVSREHARTAYGVVVTADESDVDWEATRALRLKRQRGVDGN